MLSRDKENCLSFNALKQIMLDHGVEKLYFKILGTNNNNKQQVYLGGDLSAISIIPTGDFESSDSVSEKKTLKKGKNKLTGAINLVWIDSEGRHSPAPHAKLILYPQYPEVRFSGFLRSSPDAPSDLLSYDKRGNEDGRVLFLGIRPDGKVFGYVSSPEAEVTREVRAKEDWDCKGVLCEVSITAQVTDASSRKKMLLSELLRIHEKGWIEGNKLNSDGVGNPYNAPNGGGYTLEAELGIKPNGYSEPDFLGWEVKQYRVKDFRRMNNGRVTLITPEPDGGFYAGNDLMRFMEKYGYLTDDKYNFNGYHKFGERQEKTGLLLDIRGFDNENNKITDADGSIILLDTAGEVAAEWSFAKLLDHWKRKHAEAVYVPARSKTESHRQYYFGDMVKLGEGTNFEKFLSGMSERLVIYDPGSRIRHVHSKPEPKKRNQFRIAVKELSGLYTSFCDASLDNRD